MTTTMLTTDEFSAAVAEVMHDYMPGAYAERDCEYDVEYNSEADVYEIHGDRDANVTQRFKVTFTVEAVKE